MKYVCKKNSIHDIKTIKKIYIDEISMQEKVKARYKYHKKLYVDQIRMHEKVQ